MNAKHLVIKSEPQDNNQVKGRQEFLRAILRAGRDYPQTKVAKVLPVMRDDIFPIYSKLALPVEHPIQQSSVSAFTLLTNGVWITR